jgi:hypothetical protein
LPTVYRTIPGHEIPGRLKKGELTKELDNSDFRNIARFAKRISGWWMLRSFVQLTWRTPPSSNHHRSIRQVQRIWQGK